jgi:hypothetical protein
MGVVKPVPGEDANVTLERHLEEERAVALAKRAATWTFTDHALEKMDRRGITETDVITAIGHPDSSPEPVEGVPGAFMIRSGDVGVCYNPEHRLVITAMIVGGGPDRVSEYLDYNGGTDAVLVAQDGPLDITALLAAGWTWDGTVDYVAGKRIRHLIAPKGTVHG